MSGALKSKKSRHSEVDGIAFDEMRILCTDASSADGAYHVYELLGGHRVLPLFDPCGTHGFACDTEEAAGMLRRVKGGNV